MLTNEGLDAGRTGITAIARSLGNPGAVAVALVALESVEPRVLGSSFHKEDSYSKQKWEIHIQKVL